MTIDVSATENLKLEHLSKQNYFIAGSIANHMLQSSRVLTFGTAAILGIVGVSLRSKSYDLLILLPYLVFVLIFHYINLQATVLEMGGYRKYLEEEINKIIGEKVYFWESDLAAKRHNNLSNIIIAAIFGSVLVGTIILSLTLSYQHNYSWLYSVGVVLNCVLFGVLVLALIKMKTSHEKSFNDARNVTTRSKFVDTKSEVA